MAAAALAAVMNSSTADWAVRYISKYALALVPIPPGHKAPLHQSWNQRGGYVTDAGEARQRWDQLPDHGIGAVLSPSGICSIDVDSPEHAVPTLRELGIDLDALRKSAPTIQGNPSRYRLMFRAPPGVVLGRKALVWPARQTEKPITLFELRAGDIQDVLPPTIHPETGQPYRWLTPPNSEFPPLPQALLELWQNWDSYRPELEAMCPWGSHGFNPEPAARGAGARPNVIAAFNQARSVEDLLAKHGYIQRGKRWISPTSSSGLAGVVVLDGRVYSHHASDPLADGHAHDAFDLFRILDHGGDTRAAIKAAAEDLGMGSTARSQARAEAHQGAETSDFHGDEERPEAELPGAMEPCAYHGIAGELVKAIEPHTEADPAALLVQALVAFGILIGRSPYVPVEGDRHYANLFTVLVGDTAKGRKGTSWGRVRSVFSRAEGWPGNHSGLSSGEGLKWHVRDKRKAM
ncbi:MAG: bifunctional DNA primase/polymerase, partial [bacterium]